MRTNRLRIPVQNRPALRHRLTSVVEGGALLSCFGTGSLPPACAKLRRRKHYGVDEAPLMADINRRSLTAELKPRSWNGSAESTEASAGRLLSVLTRLFSIAGWDVRSTGRTSVQTASTEDRVGYRLAASSAHGPRSRARLALPPSSITSCLVNGAPSN